MSNNVLKKILSSDRHSMELAFGKKGINLIRFAKDIDVDHPHLKDISSLNENSELICQYLDLINHLKNKKNNKLILDLLGKKCFDVFLKIFEETISPYLNYRNLRLLPKSKINHLRKQKKKQIICSKSFYDFASKSWQSCPFDFSLYYNKSTTYGEQIIKFKEKSIYFKSIGCAELANSIEEKIKFFQEYYGYKKINILYASLILAKINKCILTKENNQPIIKYQNSEIVYQAEIRSVFSVKKIPNKVKNVIQNLDTHPQAKYKPIFDNFLLLSPCLKDIENLRSIVLGEKDKNYYFICEWP